MFLYDFRGHFDHVIPRACTRGLCLVFTLCDRAAQCAHALSMSSSAVGKLEVKAARAMESGVPGGSSVPGSEDARAIRRQLVQAVEPQLLGTALHAEEKRLSRLRMRRHRANLSDEQRDQVRRVNRLRAKSRRASLKSKETDEGKTLRQSSQKERKALRLSRESPERKAQRMAADRERSATRRAAMRESESPQQRERRLEEGRTRAMARRAAMRRGETPEQRKKRLADMRIRAAAIRATETEEDRSKRLTAMRDYQTRRRSCDGDMPQGTSEPMLTLNGSALLSDVSASLNTTVSNAAQFQRVPLIPSLLGTHKYPPVLGGCLDGDFLKRPMAVSGSTALRQQPQQQHQENHLQSAPPQPPSLPTDPLSGRLHGDSFLPSIQTPSGMHSVVKQEGGIVVSVVRPLSPRLVARDEAITAGGQLVGGPVVDEPLVGDVSIKWGAPKLGKPTTGKLRMVRW